MTHPETPPKWFIDLPDHEKLLRSLIPQEQKEPVFTQDMCDIDGEFMGFMDIYYHLSIIIPKHWTIVDLGCAYAPQCFYFKDHKKYIGVDIFKGIRFKSPNAEHIISTIEEYLKNNASVDTEETFAICSYVPPWGGNNRELAIKAFQNVFVYYPHGGFDLDFTQ